MMQQKLFRRVSLLLAALFAVWTPCAMAQDEATPVVIDVADSGNVYAGLGGEDRPRVVFPAVVGRSGDGQVFVGEEALALQGQIDLNYPIAANGIPTNENDLREILRYAFQKLGIEPAQHPVLITEPTLTVSAQREKLVNMLFQDFQVPACFVGKDATLALYAAGRSCGVSVVLRDGACHVVPIWEGCTIADGASTIDMGERDAMHYFRQICTERGYDLSGIPSQMLLDAKKLWYVAENFLREMEEAEKSDSMEKKFELPTGDVIVIRNERFRCPEIYFQPNLMGMEHAGIHQIIDSAIRKCDADFRKDLYYNIVVSGGAYPGMRERLTNELLRLAPTETKIQIVVLLAGEFSSWLGGSMLTGLSIFQSMWITRSEYDDAGASIVHQKCP